MKSIPNFPGYFASRDGVIFSSHPIGFQNYYGKPGKLHQLKPVKVNYFYVRLTSPFGFKKCAVHELVLRAFVGKPKNGQQARHLNGDRFDNRLSNLKWGTAKENAVDRAMHGTTSRGVKSGASKLSEAQVLLIRKLVLGSTRLQLANRFGVSKSNVTAIVNRRSWNHI